MKNGKFYSYELVENTKCTEVLSQETPCSSQDADDEISQEATCRSQASDWEIPSEASFHPPPSLFFPKTKMDSRERPCQSSWF